MEKKRREANYLEEYPDFYKKREGFLKEDDPDLFVGREDLLKGYWWIVRDLTETTTLFHNTALISMRRIGKTAFLKRFLNVVHEEQDIVLPLYYEFKLEKRDIYEVADDIVFTFIKQALLFYTRKKKEIEENDINNLRELKKYMKRKIKEIEGKEEEEKVGEEKKEEAKIYKRFHEKIESYEEDREEVKGGRGMKKSIIERALNMSLNIIGIMKGIKGKEQKAIVVIDEAQNLTEGIIDEEEIKRFEEEWKEEKKKKGEKLTEKEREILIENAKIDCKDAITTIINDPRLCTILSGSKPSMIANDIISTKVNRIRSKKMELLSKEEVKELVEKIIEKNKKKIKKVYKRLYKDIYRLVGGNPFYIKSILIPESDEEDRTFKNKKDLIRIFNKEAKEEGGRIYEFWKGHFIENLKKLNGGKEEIGLGFKIMKIIGTKMEEYIERQDKSRKKKKEWWNKELLLSAEDIQEELKKVKIGGRDEGEEKTLKEVDEKLTRLSQGDFIEYSPIGYVITAIKDRVLPLIMDILYFSLKNLKGLEKVKKESDENTYKRLGIKKIEENIRDLKEEIRKNKETLNRLIGERNNIKGKEVEIEIREGINKNKWKFKEKYEIIREASKCRKEKKIDGKVIETEIDIEIEVKDKKTKEVKIIIIEVKNYKRKLNIKEIKEIKDRFDKYEKIYKIEKEDRKEIIKIILSRKGISNPSQYILDNHNIISYTFENFFENDFWEYLKNIIENN